MKIRCKKCGSNIKIPIINYWRIKCKHCGWYEVIEDDSKLFKRLKNIRVIYDICMLFILINIRNYLKWYYMISISFLEGLIYALIMYWIIYILIIYPIFALMINKYFSNKQ